MCTLLYIPDQEGNYLFSSSRDEHRDRPDAESPGWHIVNGRRLFFPRDPVGGGSWIVYGKEKTLCILNGAFAPHRRRLPYRHSRGMIPLDYLAFRSTDEFLNVYEFKGLESFTFLIADKNGIEEIRWDHEELHYQSFENNQPRLWASAPLYNQKMLNMRRTWFKDFLENQPQPRVGDIFRFYLNGGNGDPESGLMIKRANGVETVSISCVKQSRQGSKFFYRTEQKMIEYNLE